jgi:hypothetical protein
LLPPGTPIKRWPFEIEVDPPVGLIVCQKGPRKVSPIGAPGAVGTEPEAGGAAMAGDMVTVQGELPMPLIVALTFATPAPTAVARPALLMLKTAELLLDQVIAEFATVVEDPSEYMPIAENWSV